MAKGDKIRSLEDALIRSVRKSQETPIYCAKCGAPVEPFSTARDVLAVGPMLFHQACYQAWMAERMAEQARKAQQEAQKQTPEEPATPQH